MIKKKMLVCGASGFIGRNLTEAFSRNASFDVTAVINRRPSFEYENVNFVQADLTNRSDVERVVENQEIILQFAATTSGAKDIVQRPYLHVTDNAVMNSLILRAAFEASVAHVVFPSCTVMYRSSEDLIKEDDFDPTGGLEPKYFGAGWTKVFIEKQCELFSRFGTTKYTVLRHSNIYGPHDKYDLERSHVCGASITKVMNAKDDDTLRIWGTGEEKRDLLHIEDLIRFVELALERQQGRFELVNVGAGRAISVKRLVELIIECAGKRLNLEHDLTQPTIQTNIALDIERAERIFGWKPQIDLQKGIAATIKWYRENILK